MHHMVMELIKCCNQRLEKRLGDLFPGVKLLKTSEATQLCHGGVGMGPRPPLRCWANTRRGNIPNQLNVSAVGHKNEAYWCCGAQRTEEEPNSLFGGDKEAGLLFSTKRLLTGGKLTSLCSPGSQVGPIQQGGNTSGPISINWGRWLPALCSPPVLPLLFLLK